MRPAARVQAAIELLDAIVEAARSKGAPADRLISEYFKARRYAGSKDRRAVRELVYAAIRGCGEVPQTGRSAMLALAQNDEALLALFDGSQHGPNEIVDGEKVAAKGIAPEWLTEKLSASHVNGPGAEALLTRAPLDIRVNTLRADRNTIDLPVQGKLLEANAGLRLPAGTAVEQWQAYHDGLIEVQDHGSQLVCEAIQARPGDTVLDLCAGAGGKTLALAARFANAISVIAADTDKRRLGNLAPRAKRSGAQINYTVLLDPGREMEALSPWRGKVDHILVDAPCSGTGTWRRNPEGRWRLDEKGLARLTDLQNHVLDLARQVVRPGGTITYVTCSLIDEEGIDRVNHFLSENGGWSPVTLSLPKGRKRGMGWRLEPFHDGTDGFFVAKLRNAC